MKRKLIDENGRLFGAVSAVDVLVVILVLVLAAGVYTRYFRKTETSVSAGGDRIVYQLRVQTARQLTADALRVGDKLYESDNDTPIGTIADIDVQPARQETQRADGTMVYGTVENRLDITLTVEADGLITDGRYLVSKTYEINANTSVSAYTKYCTVNGVIWSIGG